jgi:hypothetical protein
MKDVKCGHKRRSTNVGRVCESNCRSEDKKKGGHDIREK